MGFDDQIHDYLQRLHGDYEPPQKTASCALLVEKEGWGKYYAWTRLGDFASNRAVPPRGTIEDSVSKAIDEFDGFRGKHMLTIASLWMFPIEAYHNPIVVVWTNEPHSALEALAAWKSIHGYTGLHSEDLRYLGWRIEKDQIIRLLREVDNGL